MTGILYVVLIVPAALTRRGWLAVVLIGLHTAIYMIIAAGSLLVATQHS